MMENADRAIFVFISKLAPKNVRQGRVRIEPPFRAQRPPLRLIIGGEGEGENQ